LALSFTLSIFFIYVKTSHYVLLIFLVLFLALLLYEYIKYFTASEAYRYLED
jgi:hypothetical protein